MSTAEPSYEQARAELAAIVEKLEAGGASLEESLDLWERGERLASTCQRWLDGARDRLDAVRGGADAGGSTNANASAGSSAAAQAAPEECPGNR